MSQTMSKAELRKNEKLMERSGSFSNPFEKKSRASKLRRLPIYLLTVVMIAPYYWMITSSLKSVKELQVVPPTLFPREVILGNYYDSKYNPEMFQQEVMQGLFQRYPDLKFGFFRFMINSFVVNISIILITTNSDLGKRRFGE